MRNLERRLLQNRKNRKPNKLMEDVDENYPNLEVSQIKMMYQSFDGGKLTSTLINLDIEEMCNCLAWALIKHIKFNEKKIAYNESMVAPGRDLS